MIVNLTTIVTPYKTLQAASSNSLYTFSLNIVPNVILFHSHRGQRKTEEDREKPYMESR